MRTVDEVYEKVLAVHADVLALREDFGDLKSHVNEEVMLIRQIVAGKQNTNSLLTSVLFQLMTHRGVRWGLGTVAVSVTGTVVSSHWIPWLEILRRLVAG